MNPAQLVDLAAILGLTVGAIVLAMVLGWVVTTRMRVRHGYPLVDGWGKPVYPQSAEESIERIRLLSQENAQLRAEVGAIKDRLGNVERIVTDSGHGLDREIEALRLRSN